jgi:hypothetical protein
MKAQTKSALLLFATLLVGILLGALGNSTLQNRRVEQLRQTFERRGGFVDMVEHILQPESEAQRAQIRAALEKAETRFNEDRRTCRASFSASSDSMRAELLPILTPDQEARFETWLKRDRRSNRGRNGPDGRHDRKPGETRPD